MKPLFKSQQLQKEFDENGFVHVPFLTSQKADELLQMYMSIQAEHNQIQLPFVTTSHSNNHELIRKVDKQIATIFASEMDQLLMDYQLLFGNFLIKQPGPNSASAPHQDTTFVDETKYSSISIWVALQDTDKKNGCMRFVKGSHKFKFILRTANNYPWPFEQVKNQLETLLVDYPSKKGEAFIFHHGVIHASYANLTTTPRVAALMAAYPTDAELLMLFFQEKEDSLNVQKYKMTKEAYLHYIKGEPPAMGEFLSNDYFNYQAVTPKELREMINPSKTLMQKFAERISGFNSRQIFTEQTVN